MVFDPVLDAAAVTSLRALLLTNQANGHLDIRRCQRCFDSRGGGRLPSVVRHGRGALHRPRTVELHTGFGTSRKTSRTSKRSPRCSPSRLTPKVSVAWWPAAMKCRPNSRAWAIVRSSGSAGVGLGGAP